MHIPGWKTYQEAAVTAEQKSEGYGLSRRGRHVLRENALEMFPQLKERVEKQRG